MRSCDPYGAEQGSHRGRNLPRLALLAGLVVLLLVAVGWGWTAAPRRAADAEAAATVDRETAVKALGEREAVLSEAQASADASAEKIAELEQQVQALDQLLASANADVTRLRSELLAQTAAARAASAPVPGAAPALPNPWRCPIRLQRRSRPLSKSMAALRSVEPAAAAPAPEPGPSRSG